MAIDSAERAIIDSLIQLSADSTSPDASMRLEEWRSKVERNNPAELRDPGYQEVQIANCNIRE